MNQRKRMKRVAERCYVKWLRRFSHWFTDIRGVRSGPYYRVRDGAVWTATAFEAEYRARRLEYAIEHGLILPP